MANLNVTYSDMTAAAQRLTQGQGEIEGKLNELKAMIEGLVGNGYVTDTSSKAFFASYDQFTRGATQTIGGLEGMSLFLSNAAAMLQETDAALARGLG